MGVPCNATWVFVLLLTLAAGIRAQEEASRGLQLVPSQLSGSGNDLLIVNLLDGHIVALDHATGQVLWTFDSGAPLVSTKQAAALSQGMNVFPGTDGGLYAYHGMKQLKAGLERLPISLPELVDAAPSLTADGSVILGRRESKVFMLDKRTGRSIGTISNAAGALEDHSGALGLSTGTPRDRLLLLGRQDYIVRSVRIDSKMETWNATFSRVFTISGVSGIRDFLQHGAAPSFGDACKPASLPRLVVGSDNSLQAFDSKTMHRKWYIAFDTPPVSAYRQDGLGGNCLDPDQAVWGLTTQTSHGLLPMNGNPVPVNKLRGQLAGGTTVLVGALKGSLYALPADHLMLAAEAEGAASGSQAPVVWPDRVGSMPMDINPVDTSGVCNLPGAAAAGGAHGSDSQSAQMLPTTKPLNAATGGKDSEVCSADYLDAEAAGAPSAASSSCTPGYLTLVDDSVSGSSGGLVPLDPTDSEVLRDELSSLTCPQPPLGIHAISKQQAQTVAWLPELDVSHNSSSQQTREEQPRFSSLRIILGSLLALLLLLPALMFGWKPMWSSSISDVSAVVLAQHMSPAVVVSEVTPAAASPSASSKKTKIKHKKKAAASAADSRATDGGMNGLQSNGDEHGVAVNGDLSQQHAQLQPSPCPVSDSLAPPSSADCAVSWPSVPHSPEPGSLSPVPAGSSGGAAGSEGGAGQLGTRSYVDDDGAVVIGRLRVGPGILGYGSAGTIVYEGVLDSRPVAVKRLLRQFYNLARKEIQVLVVSDEHPNVVRCFAMEEDREFVYLALERCKTSLNDTMGSKEGQAAMRDPASGSPTPWCLSVLSDIAAGLAALHARQIVHRDLKPHNVLLTEAGRAKLSDMGLSKQLVSEQSSFESHGSGGSSGWQAPEQLIAKDGGAVRQSRAVDVFSLGCVMYYCLTGGKHPYGEHYERDTNILKGASCLSPLAGRPEAYNLISAMLAKSPAARPSMAAVLGHPFWWSHDQRLQFLVDVSDRVENEDREPDPSLLHALESYTSAAVGANWGAGLDPELIANLGKYRRYDYTCLRDLLRVVRNKRNHFREMPESLQRLLGPVPEGFYRYFSSRFPMLLLGVFFFALKHLDQDPNLAKYWAVGQHQYVPFLKPWEQMAAAASGRSTRSSRTSRGAGGRRNSGSGLSRMSPSPLPPAAPTTPSRAASTGAQQTAVTSPVPAAVSQTSAGGAPQSAVISFAEAVVMGAAAAPAGSTGGSMAGNTAASTGESASEPSLPVVGYAVAEGEEQLHTPSFPSRPGKQACDFFVKTGHCKYGTECVFDHPPEYAVQLTEQGLPFRAGQPVCTFYQKTQQCKFGPSCKFHHPKLVPIYAGSALHQQ